MLTAIAIGIIIILLVIWLIQAFVMRNGTFYTIDQKNVAYNGQKFHSTWKRFIH